MTIPECFPGGQTTYSNNGNGALSTEISSIDQKKSNYIDHERENRDRIPPAIPAPMDLTEATIREVLEYFLRSTDPDAFAEFWSRVRSTIRGRCASMLQRRSHDELLDDLEQEAYMKLSANNYKVLRHFNWPDKDSIFKYMKVVAASVVIDWCRKNGRQSPCDPEYLDLLTDQSFAGYHTADLEILRSQIDQILHTYESGKNFERDRAVFWMFYRWGYSAKQIANLSSIKLPVKKVENILQGMVRRVRNKLDKGGKGASSD